MIVGGLRARLVHDSLWHLLYDGLTALGWFDTGRVHRPVTFLTEPADWDEEIATNTITLTTRARGSDFVELGSGFSEDSIHSSVDIYADTDAFANHIANDIRDMLRGRLPVGAVTGTFPILDLRLATPVPLGYITVAGVRATRLSPVQNRPFMLHWQTVDIELLDYYYDSSESP